MPPRSALQQVRKVGQERTLAHYPVSASSQLVRMQPNSSCLPLLCVCGTLLNSQACDRLCKGMILCVCGLEMQVIHGDSWLG